MKQTTFASLAWSSKGKVTRREQFLAEMDHKRINRTRSRVRARVEHAFNVVKQSSMTALLSSISFRNLCAPTCAEIPSLTRDP